MRYFHLSTRTKRLIKLCRQVTARLMYYDDNDSASVAANAASSEDQGGDDWSSE
jgi:hypothetical protein